MGSGKFNGSVEGHHCTVAIGYSNLGYSGRAAYSDLKPRDGHPSVRK